MATILSTALTSILRLVHCCAARPIHLDPCDRGYLVIAPHPDDETLGCGAMIAQARSLGIPVHVVVVTDGSGHPAGLRAQEVVSLRRRECLEAARSLGVATTDVTFLNLPDGAAWKWHASLSKRLLALIEALHPQRIFTPYGIDNHSDHQAVSDVMAMLMAESSLKAEVFCYPVWFWQPRFLLRSLFSGGVTRTYYLSSGGFIEAKKRALSCYVSQTGNDGSVGAILTPRLLRNFLRPCEYFFQPSRRHDRT